MATNWICNYAVVQATLPGIQNLGTMQTSSILQEAFTDL